MKTTLEVFVKEAISIHGDKYNYSNIEYINKSVKVRLICSKHGQFEIAPFNHLRGAGCQKCGRETRAKKCTLPNEEFIRRLQVIHGEVLPFLLLDEYTHSESKLRVLGKFGECSISARTLLEGVVPAITNAVDKTRYTIAEFKNKHGDRYDYSKYIYNKELLGKSIIICREHGDFKMSRQVHLRGGNCTLCNKNYDPRSYTTDIFIEKAKEVNDDNYDYSLVNYRSRRMPVTLICKYHGKFVMLAGAHLLGKGCKVCGLSKNISGWEPESWSIAAKSSKTFDCFKVYFVKLEGDGEQFYKIGRTFCTVNKRLRELPYTYKVIHTVSDDDPKIIFNLENHLKRTFKTHRYKPLKSFGGEQECFKFDDPTIQSVLREMTLPSSSDIIPTSTK
jgi:hypothetical protein